MNQKTLVTGAGGFIGSHLAEDLVRQGCQVRAMVHYNARNSLGWLQAVPKEILAEMEVVASDVIDPHAVAKAVRGVDRVFHLAALIAIPYSYAAPASYVATNVTGTLNVLQASLDAGVEKVVHTSTSETYGSAQYVPIDEGHPLVGQSPYSATKIAADMLAISYHRSFGLPVAIIRPFNTYGPRQSARAVIPAAITQIASGKRNIKLGSLTPTRDFNYVMDTVRGFMAIAQSDAAIGEVINVGSNFEVSIGDMVGLIAGIMGKEVEITTDDQRVRPEHSEVERLWADNAKARQLAGWAPEFAGQEGFRRGLSLTVEWICDPDNLKLYNSDTYNI